MGPVGWATKVPKELAAEGPHLIRIVFGTSSPFRSRAGKGPPANGGIGKKPLAEATKIGGALEGPAEVIARKADGATWERRPLGGKPGGEGFLNSSKDAGGMKA